VGEVIKYIEEVGERVDKMEKATGEAGVLSGVEARLRTNASLQGI